MSKGTILSSSQLRNINVVDNNEPLVDLQKECSEVVFKIAEYIRKNGGYKALIDARFARKGVAERLTLAQKALPPGFKIQVDSAYRSPKIQKKSYDAIYTRLTLQYPLWTKKQLMEEMENRVSPVDIAPHCVGGAIDITLVDKENNQLDMGTQLDEFNEKTFTHSEHISKKARENREMLIEVMENAGFVNFPAEWWHWSYGDREWAFYQNSPIAIYDVIER